LKASDDRFLREAGESQDLLDVNVNHINHFRDAVLHLPDVGFEFGHGIIGGSCIHDTAEITMVLIVAGVDFIEREIADVKHRLPPYRHQVAENRLIQSGIDGRYQWRQTVIACWKDSIRTADPSQFMKKSMVEPILFCHTMGYDK
jgi:hypothetical protein